MEDYTNPYKKTAAFWDQAFYQAPDFDPEKPLGFRELEKALQWLGEEKPRVLDFGCGHGRILLCSNKHGVSQGVGVDISKEAVEKGQHIAKKFGLDKNFEFIQGGIPELKKFKDVSFQGVIIFNVLDNLLPDHGKLLIEEIKRLLSPGGKFLLKLNPFLTPREISDNLPNSVPLEDNLFLEQSGLYFWNIPSEKLKNLMAPELTIEKENEINQGPNAPKNRLFFIQKIN